MEEESSEKIENIDIPKIEIKYHRENLRRALLTSEYFRPKNKFFRIKRLAPMGAVLALILFFGTSAIYSKILEVQAMGIARDDSKIKKLNIDFDNAKITIIPTLPFPAALATTTPPDQDKRKFIEIETDAVKYIITINLTHKEVESINTESNGRRESEDNEDNNEEKENNEPSKDDDRDNELPKSGQNIIATPTPVKNIIPTAEIQTKINYKNEKEEGKTESENAFNSLTPTEKTTEENERATETLTPPPAREGEPGEGNQTAPTTARGSENDEKEDKKSD